MDVQRERELIGDIVAVLERLFPWGAPELSGRSPHADATPQAELTVPTPAGRLTFPVVMKAELTPRAVEYLVASGDDLGPPAVVAAPWLSPATRRALSERGLNYADATGNVRLRADTVPLLVTASGASRNPQPRKQRNTRGLSGTRAIQIVWAVTTLHPPSGCPTSSMPSGGTSTLPTSPGSCAGWPKKASSNDPREVPSRMSISPA